MCVGCVHACCCVCVGLGLGVDIYVYLIVGLGLGVGSLCWGWSCFVYVYLIVGFGVGSCLMYVYLIDGLGRGVGSVCGLGQVLGLGLGHVWCMSSLWLVGWWAGSCWYVGLACLGLRLGDACCSHGLYAAAPACAPIGVSLLNSFC